MLNTENLEQSVAELAAALTGDRRRARRQGVGPRAPRLEPRRRPAPGARRAPGRRRRRRRDRALRPRPRPARSRRRARATTPRAIASLEDTILVQTQAHARRRDRRRGADRARRRPARCGWRSPRPRRRTGCSRSSGSSPDVGVVGYTLGGGLSWLARKHGLAANHVTAIELVTPDGELVRATADEHADLFWALRGGGGNFGVVTAMEFRLFPLRRGLRGHVPVPVRARRRGPRGVARAGRGPRPRRSRRRCGCCTCRRCRSCPTFLRGRSVVVIDGAYAGDAEAGAAAVAALRALGPELDTWAMVPPAALSRLHMDPEEPMPVRRRPHAARRARRRRDRDVRRAAGPGSPLLFVRAAPPRRRARRARPTARARSARSTASTCSSRAGSCCRRRWGRRSTRAGRRCGGGARALRTGAGYLNFTEEPTDAARFYAAADYERLQARARGRRPGRP